jgi:2-dehydro-3-deoxyphosphogluconate aldolase/(4S)-4-hydroxy-2-oxoglutarate aldolase
VSAFNLALTSPVLPVVTFEHAADAVPVARALAAGGIYAIEVTLRTAAALDAMRAISAEVPEVLVGAGTILKPADLEAAIANGARFGLSPGCTRELLTAARSSPLPFVPGIATSSELMLALEHGFSTVKFFPAESSGGVRTLAALGGPFPNVRFCPTGGITLTSARDYLALRQVICVGGSWLTPGAAMKSGNYAEIETAARAAAALRRD